jgi:hypothetical protein
LFRHTPHSGGPQQNSSSLHVFPPHTTPPLPSPPLVAPPASLQVDGQTGPVNLFRQTPHSGGPQQNSSSLHVFPPHTTALPSPPFDDASFAIELALSSLPQAVMPTEDAVRVASPSTRITERGNTGALRRLCAVGKPRMTHLRFHGWEREATRNADVGPRRSL